MTVQEQNQAVPGVAAIPALAQRLIALYRSERFRQSVRVALAMVCLTNMGRRIQLQAPPAGLRYSVTPVDCRPYT